MKWNKKRSLQVLASLIVAVFVFAVDQCIKYGVLRGQEKSFFGGQLVIAPFYNKGIAFSITLPEILIAGAILIALVFVFWLAFIELQENLITTGVAFGFVLGGTVGNALDRLRLGAVLDYVHVFQTSVFNLADVSIVIGLGIIVWSMFRKKKQTLLQEKA